jgi:hypothetical protein
MTFCRLIWVSKIDYVPNIPKIIESKIHTISRLYIERMKYMLIYEGYFFRCHPTLPIVVRFLL